MLNQTAHLIRQQGLAMRRGATKFYCFLLVSHGRTEYVRLLWACSVHARAIDTAHRCFHQTWIELHAKTKSKLL